MDTLVHADEVRDMRRPLLLALPMALACAGLAGAQTPPTTRTITVPSSPMRPTLEPGATIVTRPGVYAVEAPQRLDIVVVNPPVEADRSHAELDDYCTDRRRRPGQMCARADRRITKLRYLKRVVGVPGDRLALRRGVLIRNGKPVDEPYTAPCDDAELCHFPRTIRVPAGHYYVLGDNRGMDFDSRLWGPVPRSALVERVERCDPQPAVGCDPR